MDWLVEKRVPKKNVQYVEKRVPEKKIQYELVEK